MNAGCIFSGRRKWKKCPIIDENVRNMTQEAKSALAFKLFYSYGMGPGEPSVAVKQMWIFKFFGEVSNEALSWLGVYRKRRKTGPASMTIASIWFAKNNSLGVAESFLEGSRCGFSRWHQFQVFSATWFPVMAAGVVFQESNAACNCFEADRKKTKWPHVEDIINNMTQKL